jgi:histidine triad (HIT) family protein
MKKCLFCSVLAGDVAGTFLYRDESVAVFMDINSINMGHLLVVPITAWLTSL